MKQLLTVIVLYAAFVAQVALHHSILDAWAPNLMLLVGLAVARGRGGLGWAALAGLVCDCLCSRPLGVTMLAATLAVTVARFALPAERPSGWRAVAETFAGIAVVESGARMLTAVSVGDANYAAELIASLRVAAATSTAAAVALTVHAICRRVVTRRPNTEIRPAFRMSGRA